MTDTPMRTGGGPHTETFETRTNRVSTERTNQRRKRLLDLLMNPVIVAEDQATLDSHANRVALTFKPRNGWQEWLTSKIAVLMVRIDHQPTGSVAESASHRDETKPRGPLGSLAAALHRET